MVGRRVSSIGRLRQIATVVAGHGLGHYLGRLRGGKELVESIGADAATTSQGESIPASARRFRAILEDLGPTFIKFGQVLSTRADLLPAGFADALQGLQDDCPPMSSDEVEEVLTDGLGGGTSEFFREFELTPIASASVAQVHRAVTHDGVEVAVKVQRLGIRETILRDLELLGFLAQLIEVIVEESGLVTPRAVVEEFEDAFLNELDFRREARMMSRFQVNIRRDDSPRAYVVPALVEDLCSRKVLTMEFIHGVRLSDLSADHDPDEVATNILNGSFLQVFVDGLFHADPHPGNIFILEDNRLALIDFGSVGEISPAMRETLVALVVAIGTKDAEGAARLLYKVGIPGERISLVQLRDACAALFDKHLHENVALSDINAVKLLKEIFDLASRFKIRIPSEYALIGKASVTVEGIIRNLTPDLDLLKAAKPHISRLLSEQMSLPDFERSAIRGLIQTRGILKDLPLTASQILMDLESGKLQVQIDSQKLETIARNIDALGVTVFMGMMAGGLITGSMFLVSRLDVSFVNQPVLALLGLAAASMLFGGALGRYLLAPRIRKISLGQFLSKRRRR